MSLRQRFKIETWFNLKQFSQMKLYQADHVSSRNSLCCGLRQMLSICLKPERSVRDGKFALFYFNHHSSRLSEIKFPSFRLVFVCSFNLPSDVHKKHLIFVPKSSKRRWKPDPYFVYCIKFHLLAIMKRDDDGDSKMYWPFHSSSSICFRRSR